MRHSTGIPTTAELERWDDFHLVGCIACWMLGYQLNPYDIHHFLSGGKRIGHEATAPLCPAHHRGVDFNPSRHIVSLAREPKKFRLVFGEDLDLMALTDRLIAIEKHRLQIRRFDSQTEAERV